MSGDMTIVTICHPSFFMTYLMVPAVHMICLASADITPSHFIIDAVVLVIQTLVYFRTAGVILCKAILCHGSIRYSKKYCQESGEKKFRFHCFNF